MPAERSLTTVIISGRGHTERAAPRISISPCQLLLPFPFLLLLRSHKRLGSLLPRLLGHECSDSACQMTLRGTGSAASPIIGPLPISHAPEGWTLSNLAFPANVGVSSSASRSLALSPSASHLGGRPSSLQTSSALAPTSESSLPPAPPRASLGVGTETNEKLQARALLLPPTEERGTPSCGPSRRRHFLLEGSDRLGRVQPCKATR